MREGGREGKREMGREEREGKGRGEGRRNAVLCFQNQPCILLNVVELVSKCT